MQTRAIVTGHSRGLGAGISRALLDRGIAVLGLSRSPGPGPTSAGRSLLTQVALDLSDRTALAAWLESGALATFLAGAQRALLVNNAGVVAPIGALDSQAPAAIADAVVLNVAAPLMFAAAFTAAGIAPDRRILHISSGAARHPYPGWAIYCSTKAALDHHARCVVLDALPGLRICSLAPGVIDTGMQAQIRATDAAHFPMRERFVSMHREGGLADPQRTGERIVEHLLAADFGATPVADLREFDASL